MPDLTGLAEELVLSLPRVPSVLPLRVPLTPAPEVVPGCAEVWLEGGGSGLRRCGDQSFGRGAPTAGERSCVRQMAASAVYGSDESIMDRSCLRQ